MKTKNIFKTVAFAMLMPTMLLTTSCSSEDDLVNNTAEDTETVANKGYALPVTVNVTRQGDGTRAEFDGTLLNFSAGDKLFVAGKDDLDESGDGWFSGALNYEPATEKFSGTIYTEKEYDGTAEELFTQATAILATLLPKDYTSYDFLSIETIDPEVGYDDCLGPVIGKNPFALTKAAAVEQFSYEQADSYSDGFALAPQFAILNFTITDLTPNTEVEVRFTQEAFLINGNVNTDAFGTATFAIGVNGGSDLNGRTLTVDDNPITLVNSSKEVTAGKIYNISRSAVPATNLSTISKNYKAKDGETLTGTLANNVKISIADGATVTLKDVNINGSGTWTSDEWAGITCAGDATIILEGANTVKGFYEDYPGIYVPENKTVTIQGTGSLTASSNGWGAGIGAGYEIPCGNIVINSGNITATGGERAAGIGSGKGASCGNITISGGTIKATGGARAAGIGGGFENGDCGTITIKSTVTSVIATKGSNAPKSIGKGEDGSEITVNIEAGANVTQK